MKKINNQSKATMDKLVAKLNDSGSDSIKIDNCNGAFIPVHVEKLYTTNLFNSDFSGTIYSITHYFEQNGDLMKDPDMEFLKTPDGEYYPVFFQKDVGVPTFQEAINFKKNGKAFIDNNIQNKLVPFANIWLKNIKEQQKL